MKRAKSATLRVEADNAMTRRAAGSFLSRRINYWKTENRLATNQRLHPKYFCTNTTQAKSRGFNPVLSMD
jgi:ribosomal protein L33